MSLCLMYITNNPVVAQIAEDSGVNRIWVDMEYIGKAERQGGMNTVQNHHTVDDVACIRSVLTKAELMVRVNPIHHREKGICSSREEIDAVIQRGADVVMLPYFKTAEEVRRFVRYVDGRAKVFPLVETPEAVECIDEILDIQGIDEVHIGINDLSIGLRKKFMFELLADGTVEKLCDKFKAKGIPYGFGGIASLGKGLLPSEYVIKEHYRLGSSRAILSRSFCDIHRITDYSRINQIFHEGIKMIRAYESECLMHPETYAENRMNVVEIVKGIADNENSDHGSMAAYAGRR